jgi:hypothetical protein
MRLAVFCFFVVFFVNFGLRDITSGLRKEVPKETTVSRRKYRRREKKRPVIPRGSSAWNKQGESVQLEPRKEKPRYGNGNGGRM